MSVVSGKIGGEHKQEAQKDEGAVESGMAMHIRFSIFDSRAVKHWIGAAVAGSHSRWFVSLRFWADFAGESRDRGLIQLG